MAGKPKPKKPKRMKTIAIPAGANPKQRDVIIKKIVKTALDAAGKMVPKKKRAEFKMVRSGSKWRRS